MLSYFIGVPFSLFSSPLGLLDRSIIAIAHMLLNCIYHMLVKNETFNYDLYRIDNSTKPRPIPEITKEQAIALLESLGAQVTLPTAV